eukprot:UN15540
MMSPYLLYNYPYHSFIIFLCGIISITVPTHPWPLFRNFGQIFYKIFNFRFNADILDQIDDVGERFIIPHMPHGIVPLTAFMWASLCQQVKPDFYGFWCMCPCSRIYAFFTSIICLVNCWRPFLQKD